MDNITTEKPSLINQVLKFSILIAVVNIIITLLAYAIDYTIMVKWWYGLGLMFLNIGLIFYAGIEYRKQVGGYISFKEAFVFILIVMMVSGLIGVLFRLLLFNVVDPNLSETITDASIEETVAIMEKFGAGDEQIEEAMEESREKITSQYSTSGILKGYLWAMIFYVIGALIVGAIVKRNKPEFES